MTTFNPSEVYPDDAGPDVLVAWKTLRVLVDVAEQYLRVNARFPRINEGELQHQLAMALEDMKQAHEQVPANDED